jgi:hypothetical protein
MMRQSFSSVLPETGPAGQDRSPSRAPAVERIAGWSARHRKVDLKILGVGTAAAVLIDATVVRGILVPAALALLGERAWSPPHPLHRR